MPYPDDFDSSAFNAYWGGRDARRVAEAEAEAEAEIKAYRAFQAMCETFLRAVDTLDFPLTGGSVPGIGYDIIDITGALEEIVAHDVEKSRRYLEDLSYYGAGGPP